MAAPVFRPPDLAAPAGQPWPAAHRPHGAPLQEATRLAAGPSDAAASPWVVQVHIQHLEVRAPTSGARRPGPAPRPAPAAGVSLGEFLRGRRGGAP